MAELPRQLPAFLFALLLSLCLSGPTSAARPFPPCIGRPHFFFFPALDPETPDLAFLDGTPFVSSGYGPSSPFLFTRPLAFTRGVKTFFSFSSSSSSSGDGLSLVMVHGPFGHDLDGEGERQVIAWINHDIPAQRLEVRLRTPGQQAAEEQRLFHRVELSDVLKEKEEEMYAGIGNAARSWGFEASPLLRPPGFLSRYGGLYRMALGLLLGALSGVVFTGTLFLLTALAMSVCGCNRADSDEEEYGADSAASPIFGYQVLPDKDAPAANGKV